ncbi:MDR family MFS transporter [Microlunatus soli]|uniref:MFS transporter, DHA2 family, lincomycin resistance protein n=1 Tax=Microlunatus soli TaxID=630515 RepID=A0A1H1TAJ1_9ACTN|nr:MDR family MFS transporter [Microlunatus soli]SDS57260.1 MFS transporter, DHA2 family, lincomycin resistance protein [Microlunatus soli]
MTTTDAYSAGPGVPQRMTAGDRTVIGILLIAAFVVILNETIMSVALPRLMEDLHITASTGQWLTTAFMLTMAVLIPTTGFVLQRLTTRTVFILALGLFCLGTLLAGLAPGFAVLLIARIIQASGTAVMIPLLMTTVLNLVPPARRGTFMGTVSIVIAVAPAIGPTVSGLILQYLSWRFMFLIVLPIAAIALIIGILRLTNIGEKDEHPIDMASVALTIPAFGLFVFGLNQFGAGGGGGVPVTAIVALVIGIACLLVFGFRQIRLQRSGNPLLDLRVFGFTDFRKSLVVILLGMVAMFGMILILPLYLQQVHGLSTLATGLLMLPGGILMAIMGPIIGRLYDRYGPKVLMMIGTGLLSLMLVAFAVSDENTPLWLLGVQYALMMGAGMGMIMTPAMTNGLNPLPPHLYSHGSATLMTLQQVAGAAGTALLIAIMAIRTGALARSGVDALHAQLGGIHASFLVGAVAAAIAFVLSAFVTKSAPVEGAGHGASESEPVAAH